MSAGRGIFFYLVDPGRFDEFLLLQNPDPKRTAELEIHYMRGDGVEEIFEAGAGDALVIEPRHTPIVFAGCEYVAFTLTEEAKQQSAVMMPNIMKFAEEHGIELPGQATS